MTVKSKITREKPQIIICGKNPIESVGKKFQSIVISIIAIVPINTPASGYLDGVIDLIRKILAYRPIPVHLAYCSEAGAQRFQQRH